MNCTLALLAALCPGLASGCSRSEHADHAGHTHAGDDASHAAATEASSAAEADHHEHAEDPLGTFTIGGVRVELAQGHGTIAAGEEAHLVVRLPAADNGASVVRAWIGTADRMLSYVGRGEYASDHGDYDVHADAPDPLPADAQWWIEIEAPDGSKAVGSAPAIR